MCIRDSPSARSVGRPPLINEQMFHVKHPAPPILTMRRNPRFVAALDRQGFPRAPDRQPDQGQGERDAPLAAFRPTLAPRWGRKTETAIPQNDVNFRLAKKSSLRVLPNSRYHLILEEV